MRSVFLEGAGDRGFCAGGDIVAMRASALAGDGVAKEFWRTEYDLNARIAGFGKPVVAFMDGVVMGGGVGLASHASHRLATERLACAMPEVGIGFSPDVGGSWLLSRAPGELGTHLALTGTPAGAADAIVCGLADCCGLGGKPRGHRLVAGWRRGSGHPRRTVRHRPGAGGTRPLVDRPLLHRRDARTIVAALQAHPDPAARAAAAIDRDAVTDRRMRDPGRTPPGAVTSDPARVSGPGSSRLDRILGPCPISSRACGRNWWTKTAIPGGSRPAIAEVSPSAVETFF